MPPRIILATIGTKGDLHPFIAIARALQAQGFHPVLAVAEDHLPDAAAAGIEAAAVLPGFDAIARRMGLGDAEAGRRILEDQVEMFEQVILPDLARSAEALDTLADGAVAIVASVFFLAARIVAEKRGLPLVSVVLQPMALLSPLDPPRTPEFRIMRRAPVGPVGKQWNRAVFETARTYLDARYGRRIDVVRRRHGLQKAGARRMFDPDAGSALTLGLWSPQFAALPADAPANVRLVGFPLFDAAARDCAPDPLLQDFLAAGSPPLVFTLGTFAVHAAGTFYARAEEVARRLGRRAILLTGRDAPPRRTAAVLECRYLPHSQVFPHAAAVIHHGGIGTIGQALRAGKPQLVVPHMGDQNDHAWRVRKLRIGQRVAPRRFTVERVTPLLAGLLADAELQQRAAEMGERIAAERGAAAAAEAIAAVVPG